MHLLTTQRFIQLCSRFFTAYFAALHLNNESAFFCIMMIIWCFGQFSKSYMQDPVGSGLCSTCSSFTVAKMDWLLLLCLQLSQIPAFLGSVAHRIRTNKFPVGFFWGTMPLWCSAPLLHLVWHQPWTRTDLVPYSCLLTSLKCPLFANICAEMYQLQARMSVEKEGLALCHSSRCFAKTCYDLAPLIQLTLLCSLMIISIDWDLDYIWLVLAILDLIGKKT